MIKELFLLAVVFTLTYDPKTGTLENIAKPVSGTEGYRQQQQPPPVQQHHAVPVHPEIRQAHPRPPTQIQPPKSAQYSSYVDKHDHLAHIQFGMAEPISGFQSRTGLGAALIL
jgi:hypothetical protein